MLLPLLEEKRDALMVYNHSPSQVARDKPRKIKSKVQRESRRCAIEYWNKFCAGILGARERGDIRTVHKKIRCAVGPQASKLAPITSSTGELLLDNHQQLNRWVEHYSTLYSEKKKHLEEGLALLTLPLMADLDAEPSMGDLEKATKELSVGKSPGINNIPAELLKENITCLLPPMYNLLL